VKVNAPFRYSAFGLLYSAIVMAVAGGTIVGAPVSGLAELLAQQLEALRN
jgi:hypothetical protein